MKETKKQPRRVTTSPAYNSVIGKCETCDDKGFVRIGKHEVAPCPNCNPDGAPYGEADCDNF